MDLGAPELLIILVVILVLFGGARLPDLARSLGRARREFEAGARPDTPGTDASATPAPDGAAADARLISPDDEPPSFT